MKRLLLSLSASLFLLGSYAQNCETTPTVQKVKTQDGTHVPTGEAIWVCENVTLDIQGGTTTAFIEKGCTITVSGDDQSNIYMKYPGTITINGNGNGNYILDSGVVVQGSGMGNANITTCTSPNGVKYNYDNVPATPGCIDTSTVGFSRRPEVIDVKVYPNPVSDLLTIEISSKDINARYAVYSISGKMLLNGRLSDLTNRLDVTSLDKGLYFVEIESSSGKVSKRISVE